MKEALVAINHARRRTGTASRRVIYPSGVRRHATRTRAWTQHQSQTASGTQCPAPTTAGQAPNAAKSTTPARARSSLAGCRSFRCRCPPLEGPVPVFDRCRPRRRRYAPPPADRHLPGLRCAADLRADSREGDLPHLATAAAACGSAAPRLRRPRRRSAAPRHRSTPLLVDAGSER